MLGNKLANEIQAAKNREEIREILSASRPSSKGFQEVLKILGAKKSVESCRGAFSVAASLRIPGIAHYNTFIGILVRHKNLKAALDQFECMQHADIKPDVVTYNTLISAVGKARDWETAMHGFQQMRKVIIELI